MFSGGTRPFLSLERSGLWEKNLEAWKSLGVWDVSGSKGFPVTFALKMGTIRSKEVLFWGLQCCQFLANAMVKKEQVGCVPKFSQLIKWPIKLGQVLDLDRC